MPTQTRLQANFTSHERAEFIEVSLNFSETIQMFYPGDESSPSLSFPLVLGHFVATACSIKCFQHGYQNQDEIRTSHVAMSSVQNRPRTKPLFSRKQPTLCILFHLQARTFHCIKFSKLVPTTKPMGRHGITRRKFLVELPKFMNNDRDLSSVMNHARIKRHSLFACPSLSIQ